MTRKASFAVEQCLLVVSLTVLPQIINGLVDQLIHLVCFSILEHLLDLSQLLFQLLNALAADTRHLAQLQDIGYGEADSIYAMFDLAHNVVPKLEAGVAWHTSGEISGKAAGTFLTMLACCPFFAHTCSCNTVTLTCH